MNRFNEALLCPSRRVFLASAGTFVAWAAMPRLASAAVRDPRLVVIILRGAMDGLAVVPPVGDPDYASLRGDLAIGTAGLEPTFALNSFFGLNRAMVGFHDLVIFDMAIPRHSSTAGCCWSSLSSTAKKNMRTLEHDSAVVLFPATDSEVAPQNN